MKKRVFIAINLSSTDKEKIGRQVEELKIKFPVGAVRFLSPDNWHITLVFLGYQDDQSINFITKAVQETAQNIKKIKIRIAKIVYGPSAQKARMIWLLGDNRASKLLGQIQNELKKQLVSEGVNFKLEYRPFTAHVTLARFKDVVKPLPKIEQDFTLEFTLKSLDLMESVLKRSGAEYQIMSKFKLNAE